MPYETVSIVIPTYNEARTIAQVLESVLSAPILNLKKEIIVVDDASDDETAKIVGKFPVKLFQHDSNLGKGEALHTAFTHAIGDIIVIQDADLEYDPQDLQIVLHPFLY